MSKINLKTDYEDGQVLHGDELNVNNEVTQLGVNDNFERISNMETNKANKSYVDSLLSTKVDVDTFNSSISTINNIKADKTALNSKAEISDLDAKADKVDVAASLSLKADKTYVDNQLNYKANITDVNESLNTKFDKTSAGDLSNLNTTDKSSLVNAINSVNRESLPIASATTLGGIKIDGITTTIDQDGTLHAAVSSKNIFDGIFVQGSLNGGDGTIAHDYDDSSIVSKNLIKVESNTAYVFSNTQNYVIDRICYYDESGGFIERTESLSSSQFTTNSRAYFMRFNIWQPGIVTTDISEAQIEKGTVPTGYVPYISGGTTDYAALTNKPQINSVELSGNKSLTDLGLMSSADINTSLGLKADKSTTYTKQETDSAIAAAGTTKADITYVDAGLAAKANVNDVYTKSTIDTTVNNINADLALKADKSTTYTKTEADNAIATAVATKADNMTFSNNVLQLKSGTTNIGNPVTIQVATSDIAIQDTEPTNNDTKLWIDTSEDDDVQTVPSEVVDSLEGTQNDKAPSVRAVNDALDNYQEKGTILYDNASGSNANITLNDDVNNYNFIEIYFQQGAIRTSLKVEGKNGSVSLNSFTYTNHFWFYSTTYTIADDTMNVSVYCDGWLDNGNQVALETPSNMIKIYKVIGYKEV